MNTKSLSIAFAAITLVACSTLPARATVIVQDGFSGTNNQAIAGTSPDVTNLPGGTWQVDSDNATGSGTATIDTAGGNPSPELYLGCSGNSSVSAQLSISSAGSYTKPTLITIQADFNVSSMQTGNAPHGAMLGFYATPLGSGTDPITGFTGLVLQEDGSVVLVANGSTVSTVAYTGTFVASQFNTLSYTINTTTGAISNVSLTGNTGAYNFSTSAFTNTATAYAVIGARNSFGRDQSDLADNFIISTQGPIIQDGFSGTNNQAIAGTSPDITDLPGGTWKVDSDNSTGSGTATIDSAGGNPSPELYLGCSGNSSVVAAISMSSTGSYTKPTQFTIQADFNVSSMQTGDAPHGTMLGFYASPLGSGTDPITGFTGLVLQEDGSLVLVANGSTVSTGSYGGTFVANQFNTLSYTVNTTTGAISGVTLTGNTNSYSFSTSAFTNTATNYAAIGARNSFGRDQSALADNFIVSSGQTGGGGGGGGVQAVSVNSFLNSIGVCTHITQGADAESNVATCLTYAGIRNIRDDGSTNSSTLQSFNTLHHAAGTKVDLLPIDGNVASSISEWETLSGSGSLLACEGPNEPNNFPVTYNGVTSSSTNALPTAQFQAALYTAVTGTAPLAGIPVFASSEAGGSEPNNCGMQWLTIPTPLPSGVLMPAGTIYGNYANTHNYVCAHFTTAQDNNAWGAENPSINSSWDGMYVEYSTTWWGHFSGYTVAQLPTVPRVTTETGWITGNAYGPVNFTYGSSTPFVTSAAVSTGTSRNNLTGWVGFEFTVGSSSITVNKVGRWVISGNTGSHAVEIVQASNSSVIATGTVSTFGSTAGAFAYGNLATGATLSANTAYYILSQETSGGDQWYDNNTFVATTTAAAVDNSEYYNGSYNNGGSGLSQDQQGKLFLNLYLSAFAEGWSYTFIYYLHDTTNQGYWGLFDTGYNAKLSGTYLHNMTSILADTTSFSPGSLNYTVSTSGTNVHNLLMQKSNGTFYLAVWDDRPVGEGTDNVTVNLGGTYSVTKYDPTAGTSGTSLGSVSSVSLTLSDHPVILAVP